MTVCPTLGIAPVAFRYQNVYGPGQSLSNPYTVPTGKSLYILEIHHINSNNAAIKINGKNMGLVTPSTLS